MKNYIYSICFLVGFSLRAQTPIKTMFYNLMHFPSTYVYDNVSNTFIDRSTQLKLIVDEIQPDIFMVCELEDGNGANAILNTVLNVGTNKYAMPTFTLNQSSTYTGLNQFTYYNTEKLELTNQTELLTNIRDINWYTFVLNTVDKQTNPIYLEVFVAHLKASTNATNEQKRLDMITVFTDNLINIPASHHILFAGDFNFYTDSEPGYQELIDPTNAIVIKDPIQREGSWHNNSTFQDIFSQSPLTSNNQFSANYGNNGAGTDGVTGGIDDRFDFIMLDDNTINSTELYYKTNTYDVFGNNENCFNTSVNNTSCTGVFSQATRDNLFNMSDHLPVTLELEYAGNLLNIAENEISNPIQIVGSNLIKDKLLLTASNTLEDIHATIYNSYGQLVKNITIFSSNSINTIDVSNLSAGMYYLQIKSKQPIHPLKFIKIH